MEVLIYYTGNTERTLYWLIGYDESITYFRLLDKYELEVFSGRVQLLNLLGI